MSTTYIPLEPHPTTQIAKKMASTCPILVMASGSGSNFQALSDGVADGRILQAAICRLIVNRAKAYATTRADQLGIPWEYFNLIANGFQRKGEQDEGRLQQARDAYDAALAQKLLALEPRPKLVVLAGWMYIFGCRFLDPMSEAGIRVINLHPALPGQYQGAHAIERAFADFKAGKITKTGIMVHYVIREIDQGTPIMTREVAILPDDDLESLETRIHSYEHDLIVQATAQVVDEMLKQ